MSDKCKRATAEPTPAQRYGPYDQMQRPGGGCSFHMATREPSVPKGCGSFPCNCNGQCGQHTAAPGAVRRVRPVQDSMGLEELDFSKKPPRD